MQWKLPGARFALIAVFAAGLAIRGFAQPISYGTLSNFDVWNTTGGTVDDFELTLYGIPPSDMGDLWTGSYPTTTVTGNGNPTVIRWTGSSTANGQSAHFGVIGVPPWVGNVPSVGSMTWTLAGQPVATVPWMWQYWDQFLNIRRDRILNGWTSEVLIQRRVLIYQTPTMGLSQLMRGGTLWGMATVLDTTPVPLPAGQELTYDFVMPPGVDQWAIMMYDVTAVTGAPIITFLNAQNCVPEPAAFGVFAIGIAALLARRRH